MINCLLMVLIRPYKCAESFGVSSYLQMHWNWSYLGLKNAKCTLHRSRDIVCYYICTLWLVFHSLFSTSYYVNHGKLFHLIKYDVIKKNCIIWRSRDSLNVSQQSAVCKLESILWAIFGVSSRNVLWCTIYDIMILDQWPKMTLHKSFFVN